jgi:NADH-quinone oxidoreductase E subunit
VSTAPNRAAAPVSLADLRFDAAMDTRITELRQRYPNARAALLPVLWLCQERYGWISPEVISAVAERLGEAPAFVEGVVSFYTMFYTEPPARYVLQVCTTLSCEVCGTRDLLAQIASTLGIGPGERTSDGMFQVIGVQCLGACSNAPVVQINDDYHENLTPNALGALLDELGSRK